MKIKNKSFICLILCCIMLLQCSFTTLVQAKADADPLYANDKFTMKQFIEDIASTPGVQILEKSDSSISFIYNDSSIEISSVYKNKELIISVEEQGVVSNVSIDENNRMYLNGELLTSDVFEVEMDQPSIQPFNTWRPYGNGGAQKGNLTLSNMIKDISVGVLATLLSAALKLSGPTAVAAGILSALTGSYLSNYGRSSAIYYSRYVYINNAGTKFRYYDYFYFDPNRTAFAYQTTTDVSLKE